MKSRIITMLFASAKLTTPCPSTRKSRHHALIYACGWHVTAQILEAIKSPCQAACRRQHSLQIRFGPGRSGQRFARGFHVSPPPLPSDPHPDRSPPTLLLPPVQNWISGPTSKDSAASLGLPSPAVFLPPTPSSLAWGRAKQDKLAYIIHKAWEFRGTFVAKLDSPLLPGRFQALLTDSNFCCTWPLLFRELGSKTDLERAESPNKTCQTPRPGHKFPHVAEKKFVEKKHACRVIRKKEMLSSCDWHRSRCPTQHKTAPSIAICSSKPSRHFNYFGWALKCPVQ